MQKQQLGSSLQHLISECLTFLWIFGFSFFSSPLNIVRTCIAFTLRLKKMSHNIFTFFFWQSIYEYMGILFGIILMFSFVEASYFHNFLLMLVGFMCFMWKKTLFHYIEAWKSQPGTELATSRHKSPHVHCQGQTTPSMSSSLELAFLLILVSCPRTYSQMPIVSHTSPSKSSSLELTISLIPGYLSQHISPNANY